MIAVLKKTNSSRAIVEYNETKVFRGDAMELANSYGPVGYSTEQKVDLLDRNAELNSRLRNNKFLHVAFSFSKEDKLSDYDFLLILERYQQEMGISDHHSIVYKHFDTYIEHYHAIIPTVDLSGKKYDDFMDFTNSRDISRKLEIEFNLHQIKYEGLEKKGLAEKNASKYSLYNYIKKENPDFIKKEAKELILQYKLTNNSALDHIAGLHSKKEIKALQQKLNKIQPIKKSLFIERLDRLRSSSTSLKEFDAALKKEGIYSRKVRDNKGRFSYVYGDKDSSFYISESKLPKRLKRQYMFSENVKEYSVDDQKKFLSNIIYRASYKSKTLPDLIKQLNSYNIDIEFFSDKRGIYGYQVKTNNIDNAAWIKGSELTEKLHVGALLKNIAFDKQAIETIRSIRKVQRISREIADILDVDEEVAQDEYEHQRSKFNRE